MSRESPLRDGQAEGGAQEQGGGSAPAALSPAPFPREDKDSEVPRRRHTASNL